METRLRYENSSGSLYLRVIFMSVKHLCFQLGQREVRFPIRNYCDICQDFHWNAFGNDMSKLPAKQASIPSRSTLGSNIAKMSKSSISAGRGWSMVYS
jgi:hypothetical protein